MRRIGLQGTATAFSSPARSSSLPYIVCKPWRPVPAGTFLAHKAHTLHASWSARTSPASRGPARHFRQCLECVPAGHGTATVEPAGQKFPRPHDEGVVVALE
eukprot:6515487-Prymnesium_polylepis.2